MGLGEAPESQIDPTISARLRALALKEEVRSDELLAVLDDSAYGGLVSDFAMGVMNIVWRKMLEDEGITEAQAFAARDPALRQTKI